MTTVLVLLVIGLLAVISYGAVVLRRQQSAEAVAAQRRAAIYWESVRGEQRIDEVSSAAMEAMLSEVAPELRQPTDSSP